MPNAGALKFVTDLATALSNLIPTALLLGVFLWAYNGQREKYETKLAAKDAQLLDKDQLIAAKDEHIQFLKDKAPESFLGEVMAARKALEENKAHLEKELSETKAELASSHGEKKKLRERIRQLEEQKSRTESWLSRELSKGRIDAAYGTAVAASAASVSVEPSSAFLPMCPGEDEPIVTIVKPVEDEGAT